MDIAGTCFEFVKGGNMKTAVLKGKEMRGGILGNVLWLYSSGEERATLDRRRHHHSKL